MSRIKDLLLDVNYMKKYAADEAKKITVDISKFGFVDVQRMQNVVMIRYQLDQLLLRKQSLIDKWAQFMVHDFNSNSVIFRGTQDECNDFINVHNANWFYSLELYWALPDDVNWSWNEYIRNSCYNIVEVLH